MLGQRRVVLTDAGDGTSDSSGDGHAGSLCGGAPASLATPEPHGGGEFADEEISFRLGLCEPLAIAGGYGLFHVLFDFCEAPAVGMSGVIVQDRYPTRIATCNVGEVASMQLATGACQQPREVAASFEVSQPGRAPLERHEPMVSFADEDVLRRMITARPDRFAGTLALSVLSVTSRAESLER